jgi:hypothetical protein
MGRQVTKFPGRIAAVMLDEVDLEITGGFLGVLEPGKDGDGAVKEADRPGSRGSVEFHLLFWFSQDPVNGAGANFFELVGDHIGHMVFFSQPDEVKILSEERGEQFPARPVEVFPQRFEHFRERLWYFLIKIPGFWLRTLDKFLERWYIYKCRLQRKWGDRLKGRNSPASP